MHNAASVGALALVCITSCKIEKVTDFAHFEQKNTHISGCKIVHKCTRATITVHICTIIVALAFNILIISNLLLFSIYSPSAKLMHSLPHHLLSSFDTHTPIDTKSKINYKNKKINHQNGALIMHRCLWIDWNSACDGVLTVDHCLWIIDQ